MNSNQIVRYKELRFDSGAFGSIDELVKEFQKFEEKFKLETESENYESFSILSEYDETEAYVQFRYIDTMTKAEKANSILEAEIRKMMQDKGLSYFDAKQYIRLRKLGVV